MGPRWPQKAHFELFWALVGKWLPEGPRGLILSCSSSLWADGSQMTPEGLFLAFLAQMAILDRPPLQTYVFYDIIDMPTLQTYVFYDIFDMPPLQTYVFYDIFDMPTFTDIRILRHI